MIGQGIHKIFIFSLLSRKGSSQQFVHFMLQLKKMYFRKLFVTVDCRDKFKKKAKIIFCNFLYISKNLSLEGSVNNSGKNWPNHT